MSNPDKSWLIERNGIPSFLTPYEFIRQERSPGYINPVSKVLLVGPGAIKGKLENEFSALPMDMGVLFMPYYLKQPGSLSILGLSAEDMHRFGGGDNDMALLQKTLDRIYAKKNLKPKIPVNFIQAEITDYGRNSSQLFDTIWDHFTLLHQIQSPAIAVQYRIDYDSSDLPLYVLQSYLNLLKIHGKLIIYGHYENKKEMELVKTLMLLINQGSQKYNINEFGIQRDEYLLPVSLMEALKYFTTGHIFKLLDFNGQKIKAYYQANRALVIQKKS